MRGISPQRRRPGPNWANRGACLCLGVLAAVCFAYWRGASSVAPADSSQGWPGWIATAAGRVSAGFSRSPPGAATGLEDDHLFDNVTIPREMVPYAVKVSDKGRSVQVQRCLLIREERSKEPFRYPMFRDVVGASGCGFPRYENLEDLRGELRERPDEFLAPSGFVFHMARCGSTLVANMLASTPRHLVYAESAPIADIVRQCADGGCDPAARTAALRDVMLLMGRSAAGVHKKVFFKFQSSVTPRMADVLAAFPDTPWIFVFRDPVPVVASLLGQARTGTDGGIIASKSKSSPCLRTRSDPDDEVLAILGKSRTDAKHASDEEFCAARLATLLDNALKEQSQSQGKGAMLAYETLPAALPIVVRDHFGSPLSPAEETRALLVAQQYSKARDGAREGEFTGDTEAKEALASKSVVEYSERFMSGRYSALRAATLPAANAAAAAATAAAAAAAEAAAAAAQRGAAVSGNMQEKEGIEAWRRGLDRVVDPNAPDWLSSAADSEPMEQFDCPAEGPPANYPKEYPIMDVLRNWNPNNASWVPPKHYLSICRFNYATQLATAERYRDAEKPFILYNVPSVDATARLWSDPDYLKRELGDKLYHTEYSVSNRFMYYSKKGLGKKNVPDWTPPTEEVRMTYSDWLEKAVPDGRIPGHTDEHWYFRVSDADSDVIKRDVEIFGPKGKDGDIFLKEPSEQRGIHCRFGMHGVVAEAHYDGSRNMVALLSGKRRWIMSHPSNCRYMYLLPMGHPSGRHSQVDWGQPDLKEYPLFEDLRVNEVLLRAGEVLFVPTSWFHYIVNLGVNAQCNSRSGRADDYLDDLAECGFGLKVRDNGAGIARPKMGTGGALARFKDQRKRGPGQ